MFARRCNPPGSPNENFLSGLGHATPSVENARRPLFRGKRGLTVRRHANEVRESMGDGLHWHLRSTCAIAVMAKASIPGKTKTRLVPPLSEDEAATLNTVFL